MISRFSWLMLVFLAGCATPLSTLQTARTTPKGKFEAYGGLGANVSTGLISSLIDLGEEAANKANAQIQNGEPPQLTEEDMENIIGAAVAYSLFSPTPVTEAGLRFGILDYWDAGLAYTSAGFKLAGPSSFTLTSRWVLWSRSAMGPKIRSRRTIIS